jgi:hypothetical protein
MLGRDQPGATRENPVNLERREDMITAHLTHQTPTLTPSGWLTLLGGRFSRRSKIGSPPLDLRSESGDVGRPPAYSDPLLGWGRRAIHGVRTYDVPGGHSSMLQEPNVQALATYLQNQIDESLASHTVHGWPLTLDGESTSARAHETSTSAGAARLAGSVDPNRFYS